MQLKGRRTPWLWGIIALGVLLIVFGVQVLSEKLRQTRPITYLFDQPATAPLEVREDWLRGAVWTKPAMRLPSAAFSPDGQLLAVAEPRTVTLWRVNDGKRVRSSAHRCDKGANLQTASMSSAAFSPDGTLLATACGLDGSVITLWRVSDGRWLFSVGGSSFAEWDVIKLWDVESDQWGVAFRGHGGSLIGWINALAISPDGKYLASGGGDGLALWQIKD